MPTDPAVNWLEFWPLIRVPLDVVHCTEPVGVTVPKSVAVVFWQVMVAIGPAVTIGT